MSRLIRLTGWIQQGSLYFLLLFLPFSKAAVEICSVLLIVAWGIERIHPATRSATLWRDRRLRNLALALGAFIAACALSIPFSSFPALSLRAFFSKWLEYLLLFVVLTDVAARPKVGLRAIGVLIFSSALVGFEALWQEFSGVGLFRGHAIVSGSSFANFSRMTGPYENPGDLATYLMVVIPVVLAGLFISKGRVRWLLGTLLGVLILCMGRTLSLGPWLGLGAGLTIFVLSGRLLRKSRRMVALIGIAVAITATVFLQHEGQLADIFSLQDIGKTDRVVMWQAAVGMIMDRPVFGVGLNTFMANYLDYWVGGEQMPRYAHNCYLQMAAETGLIGLAAFLTLLGFLFRQLILGLRRLTGWKALLFAALLASLGAFALHAAVDTNFYSLRQAALFWALSGVTLGWLYAPEEKHPAQIASIKIKPWVAPLQLWLLVAFAALLPLSQALSNICYGLVIVAWITGKVLARDWRLPRTSLNEVLLAWVVVIVFSMMNSVDLSASLSGLRKLVKYALLYFAIVETLKTPRALTWMLMAWLGGLCVAAGDGLWQMAFGRDLLFGRPPMLGLGGVQRLTGTFHHPNDLAIFLTAGLPIAISGAILLKKHSLRLVAAGAASLLLAAVLLGYSRSGLMAMVASLVFLALLLRRWRIVMIAGLLIAVQFAMISPEVRQWGKDQPSWLHRMTEPDRLMVWHAAIGMIQDHPLIGVGANTFIKRYTVYQAPEDPYTRHNAPYAHSMYLQLAAELGLIGLGIFLIALGRLWGMWRATRIKASQSDVFAVMRSGLGAGMVAYLVLGLLESSLFYSRAAMVFWLMAGAIAAAERLRHSRVGEDSPVHSTAASALSDSSRGACA